MKTLFFLFAMVCSCFLANAQEVEFVDDAVQGPIGSHHQQYAGTWKHNNATISYSNEPLASVTITFVGNSIRWITEKKNTHGVARVYLDGNSFGTVDLYSSNFLQNVTVFESPNMMQQGTHTLKIEVSGIKNSASTGYYIVHNYFYITQYISPRTLPDISDTRLGAEALANLLDGTNNTGVGYGALMGTWFGGGNSGFGAFAGQGIDKGYYNTAVGYNALSGSGAYISKNTAVGYNTMNIDQPGEGNTAIGYYAGPGVSDLLGTTALGAGAITTANHQVRIGSSSVTSIGGAVSWSTLSDGRFKKDIKEDVSGLTFINGLRPVSYVVDNDAVARFIGAPESEIPSNKRTKEVRQTGFVAQEVHTLIKKSGYVFNGVQPPQNEKDPYTIRYAEFVVPLVKAIQELSAQVKAQQQEIETLRRLNTSGIEKRTGFEKTELYQNNPNPFSVDTRIEMVIPDAASDAKLLIYNLEGRQLRAINVKDRGETAVTIQGNELNAGMYLYTLIIDGQVFDTKRMILTE